MEAIDETGYVRTFALEIHSVYTHTLSLPPSLSLSLSLTHTHTHTNKQKWRKTDGAESGYCQIVTRYSIVDTDQLLVNMDCHRGHCGKFCSITN